MGREGLLKYFEPYGWRRLGLSGARSFSLLNSFLSPQVHVPKVSSLQQELLHSNKLCSIEYVDLIDHLSSPRNTFQYRLWAVSAFSRYVQVDSQSLSVIIEIVYWNNAHIHFYRIQKIWITQMVFELWDSP